MKPFEVLFIAFACGIFVGGVILYSIRRFDYAFVAAGVVTILALMFISILLISYKPNTDAETYLDRFEQGNSLNESAKEEGAE